jgi:hypothetical protein
MRRLLCSRAQSYSFPRFDVKVLSFFEIAPFLGRSKEESLHPTHPAA